VQTLRPDAEEDGHGMIPRSFLFVPADSEKKLAKTKTSPADALILDLEDSVAPENRVRARGLAREYLQAGVSAKLWVRINPVGSADFVADMAAVVAGAPAGLGVPKPDGAEALHIFAAPLIALETQAGLPIGSTPLPARATPTPTAGPSCGVELGCRRSCRGPWCRHQSR